MVNKPRTRLEIWSKNNVRLAVNNGEKNFFTAKCPHLLALNAVNFCMICSFSSEFFLPHSPDFSQNEIAVSNKPGHSMKSPYEHKTDRWPSNISEEKHLVQIQSQGCKLKKIIKDWMLANKKHQRDRSKVVILKLFLFHPLCYRPKKS